jgi:hypothetical protein
MIWTHTHTHTHTHDSVKTHREKTSVMLCQPGQLAATASQEEARSKLREHQREHSLTHMLILEFWPLELRGGKKSVVFNHPAFGAFLWMT